MRMMNTILAAFAVCAAMPAAADQAVTVGGALALLNKPSAPRAAIVLIPGGDGYLGIQSDGTFTTTSSCARARPICARASRR